MVDRYWRKIEDVENGIENSMQISSILLKLKKYDDKLGELSKIGDNENNISSNLSRIGDNENNVSSNLSKIGNNENNISSNLGKIGDSENNISSNLSKIGDNENNISSNLGKINNIKEFVIYPEGLKKPLILKNKFLDLIELDIFILFLKKKLRMISLKIVYYL